MNRTLLALAALLTMAAAPPPSFVAGVVRDQHGYPIAGAVVEARHGSPSTSATTASDGTFVLAGATARVSIRCSYCAPAEAPVAADGTVVAVVTRYGRVADDVPSVTDLRSLPCAHVESDLSLTPFVVLAESARTIPGPSLGDRTAIPGLLVLDGVPDYDLAAGITTFDTIPQRDAAGVGVTRADGAYAYGDVAAFGTFDVQTTGDRGAAITAGDDRSLRGAFASDDASASLAYSNTPSGDRRARVAADARVTLPTLEAAFSAGAGDADVTPAAQSALASSFSSARASVRTVRGIDAAATFALDRGTYAYTSERFPSAASWSDSDLRFDVQSHAAVAPFAAIDLRNGSGWYGAANPEAALAASVVQARYVGGVRAQTSWFDATAALGHDDVSFVGGYAGSPSIGTGATDGVFAFDLHPRGRWTLHASSSSGYALQTLLGYYGPAVPDDVPPVEQLSTNEAILGYGDASRVRIALTVLETRAASGFAASSAGAFVAWQVAPTVSVRSWYLRLHQSSGGDGSVGSTWLTYAPKAGLRVDAIWRRDLYDRLPRNHLDLALSGALNPHLAWFAASEVRGPARATSIGLRF